MEKERPVAQNHRELLVGLHREPAAQAQSPRWHQRTLTQKAFSTSSRISGVGVIANEKINKGEIVLVYGGLIIPKDEIMEYSKTVSWLGIQINDDFFICPASNEDSKIGALNHSCNPNCGWRDSVTVVAMRDIAPGEELTIDYAMEESYRFSFECLCKSENCRGVLSPDDWKIPELQKRYDGYFSPYLQEKIRSADAK